MKLVVPELSLVVLVGASGCGKSTFARRHFRATEVLSSDFFRGLVADDENAQHATDDAFDALQYVARKRLRAGRLTVIDATNVQKEARRPYVALAREYHCVPVAIVFDLPEDLCRARNRERPERNLPGRVLGLQVRQLRAALRALSREGFRYVHVLSSPEEVEAVAIERQPTWTDRRAERGPFDIVGDVHGCLDELRALLESLGYRLEPGPGGWSARPPEGRRAIFLGDLVDRGPDTPGVLRLVMAMVRDGAALCVPGNHDVKLARRLGGADVKPTHGMDRSLEQLEREPADFREEARRFLDGLVSHYVLDGGHLVVAHAGLPAEMHGRASGRVREFSLYGDTTGESDEFGLPVRREWAASYRGGALVVYGHTPVPEPLWLNRTVNIDTGCVFGGRLTALRWPEQELVSVPAIREWATPIRSLAPAAALTAQQLHDDLLDLEDVLGKRRVETALQGAVTVRAENAAAALEVLGRFAANPKWLVYLPPTMAPPATSARPGLLEHPEEVFAAYRSERLPAVVCEQKHMGSRAVVLVCRDEDAARRRFGVSGEGRGAVLTRTGRRFFEEADLEQELLGRLARALAAAGFWEEFATDWFCLDAELLPWSAKAQALLQEQYAAVGSAARAALREAGCALDESVARGLPLDALRDRMAGRAAHAARFVEAYRRYCWPVRSLDDLKLAPFHLLAHEGAVRSDRTHEWHMTTLARLCAADPGLLRATPWRLVRLEDEGERAAATRWWEELTAEGGEGMVVKPHEFVARGRRRLAQPAVKCRGPEYLRIIYGPEYAAEENLERLRERSLGLKRALALREFALGLEGLERFVRREPLRRVHECVVGVLALESEPVDPRL